MAKQGSCWGTIVIEFIGLGLIGNYLFKPFGHTGEKIFGFIVLCFCFRWALLYYRSKTICGSCKKSLPREASLARIVVQIGLQPLVN